MLGDALDDQLALEAAACGGVGVDVDAQQPLLLLLLDCQSPLLGLCLERRLLFSGCVVTEAGDQAVGVEQRRGDGEGGAVAERRRLLLGSLAGVGGLGGLCCCALGLALLQVLLEQRVREVLVGRGVGRGIALCECGNGRPRGRSGADGEGWRWSVAGHGGAAVHLRCAGAGTGGMAATARREKATDPTARAAVWAFVRSW